MSRELHTEDQAFVLLVQGREKGLKYFYAQYDTALIYFALRITGDEGTSEDIVSEAFVKLWQARKNLSHSKAVKAYLYQVVRNAAFDHLRQRKKESLYLKEAAQQEEYIMRDANSFEISAETHRHIYSTIENLPLRCGLVFRKFYLERKTLPQIARELGLSVNTVRNQKMQALTILRKSLHLLLVFLPLLS